MKHLDRPARRFICPYTEWTYLGSEHRFNKTSVTCPYCDQPTPIENQTHIDSFTEDDYKRSPIIKKLWWFIFGKPKYHSTCVKFNCIWCHQFWTEPVKDLTP